MVQFLESQGFPGISECVAIILMTVYIIPTFFHFLKLIFRWHDTGLLEFWKKWAVIGCYLFEMFAFLIMPALVLSGSIIRGMVAVMIGLFFSLLPVHITPREFEEPEWLIKKIVATSWIISLMGFLLIPK